MLTYLTYLTYADAALNSQLGLLMVRILREPKHASAYVSIRQQTAAYGSIQQHTAAYGSIRQHTAAHLRILREPKHADVCWRMLAYAGVC
jgi:hypothetical protein